MKDRLKMVRKQCPAGETQKTFADFIGTSKSNINSYEMGRRTPSDAVISLICSKCNVNETWLRTGNGDPYIDIDESEEIAKYIGELLKDSPDTDVKKSFIVALSKMDPSFWDAVKNFGEKLLEEQKKQKNNKQ